MLSTIKTVMEIIETLFRWIYLMFKHFRIVLGVILFLDFIIFLNSEHRYFPWIFFILTLYFTSRLIQSKKSNEPIHIEKQTTEIENNNLMFFQSNNQTIIQTNSVEEKSTDNK